LSALRLLWRFTHRPPALPVAIEKAMPSWQSRVYHATHAALYALFFVVPLLGWAYSSAAGFPVVLFGVLPLPDFMSVDKELAKTIKEVHGFAAFSLMALVGLHVAAAVKHQFFDKDGLINRMLLGRRI
jgi:cytochrome b561